MARMKGTAIRGTLKYVKDSAHPGGIPAVLAELPDEIRTHFKRRIMSGLWYPYPVYAGLLETVDRTLGRGDVSLMPEVGRAAALQDSGAVFKLVTSLFSVEKLLERVSFFWGRYCDSGSFETRDLEPGSGTGVLTLPEISRHHCHLVAGWIEGMAIQAGATEVAVQKVSCVHRGDPHCRYEGEWTDKS